jgi:homoserine dehydrogenase
MALPLSDPLARVDGVLNALTLETDPVSHVTIVGPGAGRELAGQGLFADLIATIRADSAGLDAASRGKQPGDGGEDQ